MSAWATCGNNMVTSARHAPWLLSRVVAHNQTIFLKLDDKDRKADTIFLSRAFL